MNGHELFARWLQDSGTTLAAVARALGVAVPTVWAWKKGKRRPANHLRQMLEVVTKGAVPVLSWLTNEEREQYYGLGGIDACG